MWTRRIATAWISGDRFLDTPHLLDAGAWPTHHMMTNRHHPEFHADPNDMTEVDLIEMVCDWTAMSKELGQDGGSARGWADKTIGNRQKWHEDKCQFVYDAIDLLDANL